MLAGIAYVTILGSVSVSTIPIVGTFIVVHSLIKPRFSDGLRMTTRSGILDFCWIGLGPKLARVLGEGGCSQVVKRPKDTHYEIEFVNVPAIQLVPATPNPFPSKRSTAFLTTVRCSVLVPTISTTPSALTTSLTTCAAFFNNGTVADSTSMMCSPARWP